MSSYLFSAASVDGLASNARMPGFTPVKRRHIDLMRVCSDVCRRAAR